MKLRYYQERAITEVCRALQTSRRVCLVAPTGSGKTVMGAALAARLQAGGSDRILWLAHRRELVEQAFGALCRTGVLATCRTVQSEPSGGVPYDLVIWDECHHAPAEDWSRVLDAYPDAIVVGLTATPQRRDGVALGSVFERLVVAASYSELIGQGHLVPCETYAGTQREKGLALQPSEAWERWGVGQGFGFAPSVALAKKWAMETPGAAWVSGAMPDTERSATLDRFRSGAIPLLWSVQLLTEGFDLPSAQTCIVARSVGSAGQWLQMAGRVLRPSPGKQVARVIDLSGACYLYGPPDCDREYSLEGEPIRQRGAVIRWRQCPACGAVTTSHAPECVRCGYVTPIREMPIRIYSDELARVYDGESTPQDAKRSELERLLAHARKSGPADLQRVAVAYRRLFGRTPTLTGLVTAEERYQMLQRLTERAKQHGYKQGWVYARLRGYGI